MIDIKYLLTDEQMAQFVSHGYVLLQTDFSQQFHQSVLQKMNEVYANEGNLGNNLVPRIPEIQQFFDHPTVRGALTSVLGPNYIMHAHRHGHFNRAGSKGIAWHKDNYWGNEKIRNHHPWSAMIFYYPQDVTEDMGPSSIMPGTHNHYKLSDDGSEYRLPVTGKAGTMALIAYDIWHTAMPNTSAIDRYMLKFLFFRMEAPAYPSWNNRREGWEPSANKLPVMDHTFMWEHVWSWLSGSPALNRSKYEAARAHEESDGRSIRQLADCLTYESDEASALDAAYALATLGQDAVAALIDGLRHPSPMVVRTSAYGLAAAGTEALPALAEALDVSYENGDVPGYVAYALGEIGASASCTVPGLIKLLQDDSAFVRLHAIEALGMIGQPAASIVPALCDALRDEDGYVRFMAGLSLARLGTEAGAAVPALKRALDDPNRYVSAIATTALQRIRSNEALDVLLPFLQTARWCPKTTVKSMY
ncbi:HEAT repeat domain-containing protein [Paenibacillus mesophilus]|uniref:HEAT repeat domain-containing protein n=1 Tax=Paenibacillus mesophilus TaxID=2582849 RepID=UPI001EE4E88D|nr:HEAT repeat domain-containing protein [Paenibacillus mesophilus]